MTNISRIVLVTCTCGVAFAGTFVVPSYPIDYATTAGNNSFPVGTTASRFQEIVGSGQFYGAMLITGLRFRAAAGTGPLSFNYSSLKITLSTSHAYPNTNNGHTLVSTTFDNNVGPDATVVYNAPFSGSSQGCSGPAPCPFDIAIPFSTAFPYDPSKGRLLVDILTPATSTTGKWDVVTFPDNTSSSMAFVQGSPTNATGQLGLGGIILGLDTTTPLITSVSNAATNIVAGLPNASIAQGAIFVIKGINLGPANISYSSTPFQSTTVTGTSASVT
ncbi:MAG TPA: hypothetical protein VLW25_06035, partial [Bryobacteraceae bacterium]|nr:hypothetical protein [Bryobacteraceae bacterium]